MSETLTKNFVDIKQIHVTPEGNVRIVLENKVIDEFGLEMPSTFDKLFFEKNADVSNQMPIVKKICNDAWNLTLNEQA